MHMLPVCGIHGLAGQIYDHAMAKALRVAREGMSFVTAATQDRRPIFEITRVADLFVEALLHYRMVGHYKLHAYVVMPDHVHLVLTPQGMSLEQAVNLIKTGFVHRLETELPIWEENFTGYSIANIHDLEVVRAYLHELPVKASLVPSAEMYPHSSAYRHTTDELPVPPDDIAAAAAGGRRLSQSTATSPRKKAS
jgi:putative transposase